MPATFYFEIVHRVASGIQSVCCLGISSIYTCTVVMGDVKHSYIVVTRLVLRSFIQPSSLDELGYLILAGLLVEGFPAFIERYHLLDALDDGLHIDAARG